jgi:hypothetical protein
MIESPTPGLMMAIERAKMPIARDKVNPLLGSLDASRMTDIDVISNDVPADDRS